MKTVRVENNKVVVECDGARVSHSLASIQKVIRKLEEDLEMWRNYERLLTPDAADLLPRPACCASFVFDGTHHKDCRFAKSASG